MMNTLQGFGSSGLRKSIWTGAIRDRGVPEAGVFWLCEDNAGTRGGKQGDRVGSEQVCQ